MPANRNLASKQGIEPEAILRIDHLHELREKIHYVLYADILKPSPEVGQMLYKIEEHLQDEWQFSRNMNMYKFWEVPKCKCPKMDCEDRFPYGRYVVSESCLLHGKR